MTRIGILAGGGRLPQMIAESVVARGDSVHIVAIEGEADAENARFPHTWVNLGQVGRIVATLRAEAQHLVIAGSVRRPDMWKVKPDAGFFTSLPRIVGLMAGGDDSVLTRVVHFFEEQGLNVRGAHEVAPDLLAASGPIGALAMTGPDQADAELAFAVKDALGPFDAGQAVVVRDGRVLAIEGAEGTDPMLQRVAGLPAGAGNGRGMLVKGPKPGQELRVDMPAIGPRTIECAKAARLAGVAVEAGAVLILDKAQVIATADALGCVIHGLARPARSQAPRVRAQADTVAGRVIGRYRPGRGDAADMAKGLAAVSRLARFDTGAAAVVARAHVLAVEAAEGTAAMLDRVAGLRQWGRRGNRRLGVLVRRIDADEKRPPAPEALLEHVAAQGLAGVAFTGPAAALAPYETPRFADRLGLFLVACETLA